MQSPRVRPLKREHLSQIAEIEREAFKEPYSEELLKRELSLPFFLGVVAEVGGRVVGYAFGWKLGESFELHRIAVRKGERGRGVGRELLRELLKRCREEGVKEVFLEVRKGNAPAVNLYRSLGFKEVGERENYYGDESALIFSLKLR
jgi:ribosomal-protein-alanine N-acetyltransferase